MGSGKNSCKTAAVMSLLGKGPEQGQAAPAPQVRDIETITGEILAAKRAGGELHPVFFQYGPHAYL